ncbi:MAG: Gfo/Idh/MocA family oxidoreductase [Planctomycetota bacterium]
MTTRLQLVAAVIAALFTTLAIGNDSNDDVPLRLAVLGCGHGHVEGLLWHAQRRDDVELVGIWDRDSALRDRMAEKYAVDDAVLFDDLHELLNEAKPEAVAINSPTSQQLALVQASVGTASVVMVEKPLGMSAAEVEAMRAAANEAGSTIVVNYETTWYASLAELKRRVDAGELGTIRRLVAHHGHLGPIEIGCSDDFLAWLLDTEQNGGGALPDFGCYGLNHAYWLFGGRKPVSVMASMRTLKPDKYAGAEDDATVLLDYGDAEVVIHASWAWPDSRKRLWVYGDKGWAVPYEGDRLEITIGDRETQQITAPPLTGADRDMFAMMKRVARGGEPGGLSSFENAVFVREMLDAAAESAEQGRAIVVE